MDERDRKWFSFSDAASAVDEPDLQALIRSFGDSGFRAVAQPRDVVQNMGDKTGVSRMFARSEEHTSELQSLMRISYAVFCLKTKTSDWNKSRNAQATVQTQTDL